VADDDPDDLFYFMELFCRRYPGYRVENFTDVKQVLEFLSGKPDDLPRLIVLDYKMPLVSGTTKRFGWSMRAELNTFG
jgi:CheY-like chemotaxis protein